MGGATAQVGDPSGKTKERQSIKLNTVQQYSTSLKESLQRVFDNHELYFCDNNIRLGPSTKYGSFLIHYCNFHQVFVNFVRVS